MRIILLALLFPWILSCDPDRKRQCEWYLIPEPDYRHKVEDGFIPVCARNLQNNKQDCKLQTTLEYAKKMYEKKFRYIDLKVKNTTFPRTIDSIRTCD